MKTLGKAIANKIALVLSHYFNGSVAKFKNQIQGL